MKDFCRICGQWKGLHEANTLHCPVDGTESGLFTEATYQDSEGMEATIAAQAARIAELESLFADAKDIIDAKNKKIMELKRNKGIAELEAAASKAVVALTNISLAVNIEIQEINDGEYEISDILEVLTDVEKDADTACSEIESLLKGG